MCNGNGMAWPGMAKAYHRIALYRRRAFTFQSWLEWGLIDQRASSFPPPLQHGIVCDSRFATRGVRCAAMCRLQASRTDTVTIVAP